MTTESTGAIEIFYSYAHEDEKYRKELDKYLYHLKRQELIAGWYDQDISAGTEWKHAIDTHLNTAHVILLLVSQNFMASDYCYSIEMKRALERHEAGEARVIPIILKLVEWRDTPFGKLQALPKNAKPVTRWKNQNEAFYDIEQGIRKVLKELSSTLSTAIAPSSQQPQEAGPSPVNPVPLSLPEIPEPELAPVWQVPYPRSPFFTDREDILLRLHEMFTQDASTSTQKPVVLSGMGGMGKTQIAIEYAHRYREEYHFVLWARADSRESLTSELASFAVPLNLPGKREQDQQYALDAVKRWLEVHTDWLLILDNIEDLKMASEYLPATPQGHILITAHTQVISGIGQRITIEKMTPEDGAILLLRRANLLDGASEQTRLQAREIVEMLDGLPLAIDQAGAYIEETGASLRRYLDLYARQRSNLLNARGGLPFAHPESVTATLSLSFEKVEQSNPIAAELLRCFAFLHPDAIPDELIEHGASQPGSELQAVASDPFSLDKAMGELLKYSLVRRNPGEDTLTIHRLVQAVIKDSMDEQTQRQWAERIVRAVSQVFPKVEFANWQACQLYLPQAQNCSTFITFWNFTFPEAASLLQKTGEYLHQRGQYTEAVPFIAQALDIREQTLGAEHPDVAESLNELGELYRKQGKYREAEPLYQRALTVREHILGPDHPDVATSLNNLARPYHHLGRYSEAEPLYQRALAIREQVLGHNHPDVAQSLNDLASLYGEQGRSSEVEPLYQRAFSIREHALDAFHPDVAQSLNNLGRLYIQQGRYNEAETFLQRALAINEQALGPNHPDTSASLIALGALYYNQGRYDEAEPLLQRALAICEQMLGPNHPDTANGLNNLGSLYFDKRDFSQAEPLLKRALAINEQKLGLSHPTTVKILQNYIILLRKTNRKGRAAEMEAHLNRARKRHR